MKVFQLIAVSVLITAEEVEGQITTLAGVCLENSDPAIAWLLSGSSLATWEVHDPRQISGSVPPPHPRPNIRQGYHSPHETSEG